MLHDSFGQTQLNIPEYITQKFQSYCKSVPREEIYIHTDREEYISGENIWFSMYLVDRQSLTPSVISSIVYFEILNSENTPILQKRFLVDKGFGPGQVILPDSLSSGKYTIRAYTNWMKNFMPYNCYMKDINIYNHLRSRPFIGSIRTKDKKTPPSNILLATPGLKLKVNNLRKDSLELYLEADENFRAVNNNIVYLFIQSRGAINYLSEKSISEFPKKITLGKESIPSGITQITIFDSKGPVVDRFIYIPEKENTFLTLNTSYSFKKRGKVTLDISDVNESSVIGEMSNLSISVAAVTEDQNIMNINDFMVFGSEFGFAPQDFLKGRKLNQVRTDQLDSLMLTLNSNWINWEKIFSNEKQYFKYSPEKEVQFIYGRLLKSNLEPEGPEELIYMSALGKIPVMQYTRTDNDGKFNLGVDIDGNLKDIIMMSENSKKNQKIYVESSFSDQYIHTESYHDSISKSSDSLILRQGINYRISKIYGQSSVGDAITSVITSIKPTRFYGKPDFELIMKDFIKLDSMQEVFFELVPHVAFQRINSVYEMWVTDPSGNKLNGNPLVMLDGVPTKDFSIIANLDPEIVDKIDVVWDRYRIGGNVFSGIVNIKTKSGDFSNFNLAGNAIRLHYRVIDPVSTFITPDYSLSEMKSSRLADYRNTLYWNPNVKTDNEGKAKIEFWLGDILPELVINVQGINTSGIPVWIKGKLK